MKVIAALILSFALATTAQAGLNELIDATVRVHCGESLGTGTTYAHTAGKIYVLTNAHVVADHKATTVEFWRGGHKSNPIPATVVFEQKNDEIDAAVLAVPDTSLGGYIPPLIKFAPADYQYTAGQAVATCGCPKGSDPTLYVGRLLRVENANVFFQPPPMNGRSGSAITTKDGDKIIGLLFARTVQEPAEGLAVKLSVLHKYLNPAKTSAIQEQSYPAPSMPIVLIPQRIELLQYRIGDGGSYPCPDSWDATSVQKVETLAPGWSCGPQGCKPRLPFGGGSGGSCGPNGCNPQPQPVQPQPQPQQPDNGTPFPTLPPGQDTQPQQPQPVAPQSPTMPQPVAPMPKVQPQAPQQPTQPVAPQAGRIDRFKAFAEQYKLLIAVLLAVGALLVLVVPIAARKLKNAVISALKEELRR